MNIDELRSLVQEYQFEKFRADQIYNWIYKNNINSFDDMQNIPTELIVKLSEDYVLNPLKIIQFI